MISIFRKYYLILGIQIIPMLTGFLTCLLPGLDEQDEALQKSIFEMLNDVNSIVGDKFYISAIWFILLKNSKNRLACFKILSKKFDPKIAKKKFENYNYELSDEEKQNELLMKVIKDIKKTNGDPMRFFPNSWTIVNALCNCLEDEVNIKKSCLDFIIKNIK